MANEIAYRLMSAPSGRTDGGAQVSHDVFAIFREQGGGVDWQDAPVVPGYHKTILLPSAEAETVMDMFDGTGAQKSAKNQAYKALLLTHRNDPATPSRAPFATDWSQAGIDAYLVAYDIWAAAKAIADAAAAAEAARVMDYIVNVLGQTFPVSFQL